ncbi:MAG: hypothetical protein EON85_06860, partial [Brevundimonas sp.]
MAPSGYLNVEPDRAVTPVSAMDWSPELVAYDQHAAYQDLVREPSLATRLQALGIFGVSMGKLLFKRLIRYEFIPHDIRSDRSFGGRLRFTGAALRNMARGDERARRAAAAAGGAPMGRLAEHGIHVVTMPMDRFEELEAIAQPDFDRLVAR